MSEDNTNWKLVEDALGKEEADRMLAQWDRMRAQWERRQQEAHPQPDPIVDIAEVCEYIAGATADPDHPPMDNVYRPGTRLVPRRDIQPSANGDVCYYVRPLYPSVYATDRAIVESLAQKNPEPPTGMIAVVDSDGDFTVMPFPVWRLCPAEPAEDEDEE